MWSVTRPNSVAPGPVAPHTAVMDPVELRTPHLILRRPDGGDAPAIAEAYAAPGIQRYVPVPSPYTEGDAHEFVATAVRE
ncbi:hypothetical protein TPB0596_32200 [Tsukamurella pulmonis]|nr:hypothetical protein TPB0596_32200 [Tsukamurella pulmonis]